DPALTCPAWGGGPSAAPPTLQADEVEQPADDLVGGEALARHGRGMGTGARVVGLDLLDGTRRLVDGAERVQPGAERQVVAEAGVLLHCRSPCRQVTRRAIAEPSSPQPDVQVLRDGEL